MIKIALYTFIFCFWILFWFAMIWATGVIDEVHKIYTFIQKPTCDLSYWVQSQIDWIYNNLDIERVNREIEVKCQ